MITKLPSLNRKPDEQHVSYNKRRHNSYKITDFDMNVGQTLLDSVVEEHVAPLITINGARFTAIPRDGNPQNVDLDNILISGVGAKRGLDEASARRGDLLRVVFDENDNVFSYLYTKDGVEYELREVNFYNLRRKVADLPGSVGLRNINFLLNVDEYRCFFEDFRDGVVRFDSKNIDICSYKNEQICEKIAKN